MNQGFAYLGLVLFLILPPGILFVRHRLGASIPWWAVVLLVAGGGWVLINLGNYVYGLYACEAVRGVSNPPEEALARCVNDGARDLFALLFGWLYALLYSLPYFLLFALVSWGRRHKSSAEPLSESRDS